MVALFLVVALIQGIVFAAICGKIANLKGQSGYGIWGFFLGPIGLIAVAALPDDRQLMYLKIIAEKLVIAESFNSNANQ